MEVVVKNIQGAETGRKVTLPEAVFGIQPNDHAIYLDVKQYLANQRQGTHKAKQRNEVSGSTRKLIKQKGTGGARHGSIKAPIYVGGGRVFGPQPRDYGFKLNKKVKQLARRSALAYKAQDSKVTVLEAFSFEAPKTKEFVKLLSNLQLEGTKTLMLVKGTQEAIYKSARNLPKAKVMSAEHVNTYELLHADALIIVEDAMETISNF